MLPKNKLRERRLARLRIFEGAETGPFGANVVRRFDSSSPPSFSPQCITPGTSAHVESRAKTREVDPKLLEEWQEIATAQKWNIPSSLATAKAAVITP